MIWRWGPTIGYMAIIFAVSSMSRPPVPRGLPDAAYHVPEFLVLGVLVARSLFGARGGDSRSVVLAILITSAYGALDELHQWFVPGRVASWSDVGADVTGAVLGVIGWSLLTRRRGASPSPLPPRP